MNRAEGRGCVDIKRRDIGSVFRISRAQLFLYHENILETFMDQRILTAITVGGVCARFRWIVVFFLFVFIFFFF